MRKVWLCMIFLIALSSFIFVTDAKTENQTSSFTQIKKMFMNPPAEFRSAPLWVWNDLVTKEEIDHQLKELKAGGLGGVFIHPRPGLITPYLSKEWYSLCRYSVDKGKELGMNVWLYDENSYPSGFAGGNVPAQMPESYNQGQGLVLHQVDKLPQNAKQKYYLILKRENSTFRDITEQSEQEANKKGDYYLFEKSYYKKSPWHGGYSYVDLLLEGVTEKFIDITMTGYEKAIGHEFGKAVPGIFTDEPNITPPSGIRWTPTLFDDFQQRWGYDLKTNLPLLFDDIGDWKRVRHNYYSTLLDLFITRWSKPWYQYCEEKNLSWTGHYWEHGWPHPGDGSDNMAMYAWHQMPAIDLLMNQYSEDVHAQFGNVRIVKELASVANQMGRTRTLSETYGAGGWDMRFEDMKSIGDWEYVLGVNFLNQHLSYITIKGSRKRDHPLSFSYHEPWWKLYKTSGDYFARLSLALSSGKQVNHILVLEPTTTAWMYFSTKQPHKKFAALGPAFQNFVLELEKNQIEYDLGSENIIRNNGKIVNNQFVVGQRSYNLVVLPPGLENLDSNTAELLQQYLKGGGKILSITDVPECVDGSQSTAINSMAKKYENQWISGQSLAEKNICDQLQSDIFFQQPELISGKLFHHRRELQDGNIVFLVNTSLKEWSTGSFELDGKSALELDLANGELDSYPVTVIDNKLKIDFDIPPAGSLLLYVSSTAPNRFVENKSGNIDIVPSKKEMKIERMAPNVLTLDYCDIKINGKEEKDIYFYRAADKIFRHYGFEGNPWGESVQYKTSILDQDDFPEKSGFEATYSFFVGDGLDKSSLFAAIERPDLWNVSVNGVTVAPNPDEKWLDRAFGVFDLSKHVVVGENHITLKASPMSVHAELEPVYICGNFALKAQEKGWTLEPVSALSLASWKEQGLPFYADGVSYTQTFQLTPAQNRYVVKLTHWQGSVAEIHVNKKSAGVVISEPYELDISDFVRNGENKISVTVYGTLKNTLGPHHIGKIRGTAWPSSFQAAPDHLPGGNDYDFINYGLFKDFVLLKSDGPAQRVYWRDYKVAQPVFASPTTIGIDSPVIIALSTITEEAEIRYTMDGSEPDNSSLLYSSPIKLNQSTVLKAKAFKKGMMDSPVQQQSYHIVDSQKNGLNYYYYEGMWENVPDFDTLTVMNKGRVYEISLNEIKTHNQGFALTFTGYIQIEKGGEYNFYLDSNDGSKLFIDDVQIVNNDGLHGLQEKQGKIALEPGLHAIEIHYFDAGGNQGLNVRYKSPGIERQIIPADKLFYKKF